MTLGSPIALVVSATLALGPAAETSPDEPAGAAVPTASEPAAEVDPALAKAESLYDRGRAKFETVDYKGAIELWTEAYGIVPDSPESAPIKAALMYNIATAQDRAYNIDQDLAHLRAAAELMGRYIQAIPVLYEDEADAERERAKATAQLDELNERIAAAEAAAADKPEQVVIERTVKDDTPREDPTAQPLIISGAVLTVVGVGGMAMMIGGIVMGRTANDLSGLTPDDFEGRQERFDRGERGNTLAYVGGIAGGALLATGAVLLGLGLHRKKKSGVQASAAVGPGFQGLQLRGRF